MNSDCLFDFMKVSLLSRIHHRNLVQFYGFCQEDGKDILVYEFMHNGTLKEHLYGNLSISFFLIHLTCLFYFN